jgi:hypothetical protein
MWPDRVSWWPDDDDDDDDDDVYVPMLSTARSIQQKMISEQVRRT